MWAKMFVYLQNRRALPQRVIAGGSKDVRFGLIRASLRAPLFIAAIAFLCLEAYSQFGDEPASAAEVYRPGTDGKSEPLKQVQAIRLPSVRGGFDLMAVDVAGRRLFVDAEDNNTTEVIDLSQGKLAHEITGMHTPKWVVYRKELNRLYVANGDGAVRVLNATTFQLLHSIAFKEKANNLHFDPATGELFVGVGESFGAIDVINTKADDRIVGSIPLASSPNQFQMDGNLIYVNVPKASHVAVIDRRRRMVVATWPLKGANDNLPMSLDRAHQRLFVGFASGKLAVVNSITGKQIAALDIADHADGIYYDSARGLIYVSCGAGWIDVIRQADPDHYSTIARIATAKGAGTSLFVPEFNRFFLAVPQRGNQAAEIRVYQVTTQ